MTNEYTGIDFDQDIDLYDDLNYDDIATTVQDGLDIEKIIASIRRAREEIEFLKELKKRRVEPINVKITKLEDNEEKLRDFILEMMPTLFPKKNSVDFPGVGKISKRKTKGKWVVTDEESFLKVLKEYEMYDEVVKLKATVDKKKVPNVVSRILTEASEDALEGVEFQEPEKENSLVLKIYEEVETVEVAEDTELGF